MSTNDSRRLANKHEREETEFLFLFVFNSFSLDFKRVWCNKSNDTLFWSTNHIFNA